MTAQTIATAYLKQYPNASTLTAEDLHSSVSQYVISSYANAHASIQARQALGMPPRQPEIDTRDTLSPYLGNVSPIVEIIRPAIGLETAQLPDVSFQAYAAWRKTNPVGGKGLFD